MLSWGSVLLGKFSCLFECFSFIFSFSFLSLFLALLLCYQVFNLRFSVGFKNFFKFFLLVFLLVFFIVLTLKIYYFNYFLSYQQWQNFLITHYFKNQQAELLGIGRASYLSSLFGDTLLLLCVFVTLICWVILGERFFLRIFLNLGYFLVFLVFTLNMVYTLNLLNLFLFFEFIFLPSLYFVYILGYSKKVDKTINFLLTWTFCGALIVFFGLGYLLGVYKTTSIFSLLKINFSNLELLGLYLIFFFGFGVKVPLWPFHYWLTKVHVEAPAGFSIFLSGFLVKTALYCLFYFIFLFHNVVGYSISLGVIFWGSLDASIRMWFVVDIKKLIAFATIQEMNLILIFFFLTWNLNLAIVNLFFLVHGVLSSLFFFLIEQIQRRTQTRNLTLLGGIIGFSTFLGVCFWGALLVFRGFPLFIKFFIEWELLFLLWENYYYLGFIFFFFNSLFSVLGFSRVWFILLYGVPFKRTEVKLDLIKKDLYICVFLLGILFFLNSCVVLFKCLVLKNK